MRMVHQLFSFLLAEDCTDGPKGGELLYRPLGESAGLLAYGLRPLSPVANGRTHPQVCPPLYWEKNRDAGLCQAPTVSRALVYAQR